MMEGGRKGERGGENRERKERHGAKVPVARSQAGSAGWRGDPRITVGAVPTTATLIDAERARLGDVTECRSSHAMTFFRETSAATSFLLRGSGNGSTFGNGCIIGGAAGDTASDP